jgi:hypothetical protein
MGHPKLLYFVPLGVDGFLFYTTEGARDALGVLWITEIGRGSANPRITSSSINLCKASLFFKADLWFPRASWKSILSSLACLLWVVTGKWHCSREYDEDGANVGDVAVVQKYQK